TASNTWTLQAHMGAKWDTFSGADFSQCACAGCDGSAATRVISPCTLGYPDSSPGVPKQGAVVFNENECLHSFAVRRAVGASALTRSSHSRSDHRLAAADVLQRRARADAGHEGA